MEVFKEIVLGGPKEAMTHNLPAVLATPVLIIPYNYQINSIYYKVIKCIKLFDM